MLELDSQFTPAKQSKYFAPSSFELSETQIYSVNNEKEIHSWSLLCWKHLNTQNFLFLKYYFDSFLHFIGSFLLADFFAEFF